MVFISLLCLVSVTFAEPPVGDGYSAARSSPDEFHHDHDHDDNNDLHTSEHQRSLSQEYRPPSSATSFSAPSTGYEYNAAEARSSLNARGRSQYPPPTVRVSFNQRFSSAATRNSVKDTVKSLSQGYAVSDARSRISQDYGVPAARSFSQEHGVPSVSARILSTEYSMPDTRSTPSQVYSVPVVAARSNQKSQASAINFRSVQPAKSSAQDYSKPAARSQILSDPISHSNSVHSARSNNVAYGSKASTPFSKSAFASRSAPSSTFDAPNSRSLLNSYGTPFARNSGSGDSISQTYGAPSQSDLSKSYVTPTARGLSQTYGVPSSQSSQMTDDVTSSYAPGRSAPSSKYLPSARNAMLAQQYGVPEQDKSQGYDDVKARALEELLNQEPANYDFAYQIEDNESGSDFGHTETRQDNRAQGSYFVVLPDGTKQTVEYEADERGFKPRISVEPAAGGYDENAADIDLARSAKGPY